MGAVLFEAAEPQTALALPRRVRANVPVAVRKNLATTGVANDRAEAERWEICGAGGCRVQATEDFRDWLRAFVEKRAPQRVGRQAG